MTDARLPARPARPRSRKAIALRGFLSAVFGISVLAVGPIRAADAAPGESPAPSASAEPSASVQPSPTPTPTPAPTPVYTVRTAYRPGAAVRQYTLTWCVPASTQIMLNIIWRNRPPDTTRATQTTLAKQIGVNNRYRYNVPGNDIRGWAKVLNARIPADAGIMYRDRAFRSQSRAMWAIVDAIRQTGHPVGITVWHGRHAWTVVGYRLSHMPATPDLESIAGFYVVGPLKTSRYTDPFPSAATATRGYYMSVSRFKTHFSWYDEDHGRAPWHRSYVMVRPEPVTTAPGF